MRNNLDSYSTEKKDNNSITQVEITSDNSNNDNNRNQNILNPINGGDLKKSFTEAIESIKKNNISNIESLNSNVEVKRRILKLNEKINNITEEIYLKELENRKLTYNSSNISNSLLKNNYSLALSKLFLGLAVFSILKNKTNFFHVYYPKAFNNLFLTTICYWSVMHFNYPYDNH